MTQGGIESSGASLTLQRTSLPTTVSATFFNRESIARGDVMPPHSSQSHDADGGIHVCATFKEEIHPPSLPASNDRAPHHPLFCPFSTRRTVLCRAVPLKFLRDQVYDMVADNRYSFMGRREECRCSDERYSDRFV